MKIVVILLTAQHSHPVILTFHYRIDVKTVLSSSVTSPRAILTGSIGFSNGRCCTGVLFKMSAYGKVGLLPRGMSAFFLMTSGGDANLSKTFVCATSRRIISGGGRVIGVEAISADAVIAFSEEVGCVICFASFPAWSGCLFRSFC